MKRHRCDLHAYVLMSNHTHLLVTPGAAGAVSRMMQMFGRNYVASFNARHGRTGTLWEGRYKSCLVDSEEYLLICYRYIELNPVRAWMIDDPAIYPWSSYKANCSGQPAGLLTPHPTYTALGIDASSRGVAYRKLIAEKLSDELLAEIRGYLQQQKVLGTDRFRKRVEAELNRFTAIRPAHRPRKS